jgi:hypothetical protein
MRRLTVVLTTPLMVVALVALAFAPSAFAGGSDDQQIADDSVITASDVPSAFDEVKPAEDQEFDAPACATIRKSAKAIDAAPNKEVAFGVEEGKEYAQIENKVSVFSTAAKAKAVYAPYASPKALTCLKQAFTESIRQQRPNAKVTVDLEVFEPDLGDQSVGYEGSVSAGSGDANDFFVEIRMVRVGRGLDSFFIVNSSGPPPSDDVESLVTAGVDSLTENLAA